MKTIKVGLNTRKDPCSKWKCLNVIKMSVPPKIFNKCNVFPMKISMSFTKELDKWILKYNKINSQKFTRKTLKGKSYEDILMLPDIKKYYRRFSDCPMVRTRCLLPWLWAELNPCSRNQDPTGTQHGQKFKNLKYYKVSKIKTVW